MTKERLEELIKQRATIYDRETTKIILDKYSHVYQDYLILGHSIGRKYEFYLRDLFETEEQALWAYKTATKRTERFEPPMWEDRTIDHKGYTFMFVLNNELYIFRTNQFKDEIRISKIEYDGLLFNDRETTLYLADTFTKENYEKACEIVRDLFKGEK